MGGPQDAVQGLSNAEAADAPADAHPQAHRRISKSEGVNAVRDLPIIFPISLAVLLAALLFTSAYAVSANAVADGAALGANAAASADNTLFEKGALLVCPFH